MKDLGLTYELKEAFYEIWDAKSRDLALDSLKHWRERVPEHLQFAFKDLLTALKNWEAEIFAYYTSFGGQIRTRIRSPLYLTLLLIMG